MMNLPDWINSLSEPWAQQIGHAAWQSAIIGLVAILFVHYASRIPSQIRYAILLVALAKFAVPPTLSLPTGVFGLVRIVGDTSTPRIAEHSEGIAEQVKPQGNSDGATELSVMTAPDLSVESDKTNTVTESGPISREEPPKSHGANQNEDSGGVEF